MSAYPPPTETLPIFNVNEFIGTTSTSQGGGGGGGTFVNYPNAQGVLNLVGFNSSGTASITNLVVNGTSDINNNINLSGDIVFDGINGFTLPMPISKIFNLSLQIGSNIC